MASPTMAVARGFMTIMLVACVTAPAAAQVSGVSAGTRVRVAANDGPALVGTVGRVAGDTLLIETDAGDLARIAAADMARLEISSGMRRRTATGAVAGAFIGIGAGAVLMTLCNDQPGEIISCSDMRVPVVLGSGGIGLLLGTMLGHASRSEQWENVPVVARVGMVPAAQGSLFVVGLTIPARRTVAR